MSGNLSGRKISKAKFEDGTLTVLVPKEENEPKIEEDRYIAIEG